MRTLCLHSMVTFTASKRSYLLSETLKQLFINESSAHLERSRRDSGPTQHQQQ